MATVGRIVRCRQVLSLSCSSSLPNSCCRRGVRSLSSSSPWSSSLSLVHNDNNNNFRCCWIRQQEVGVVVAVAVPMRFLTTTTTTTKGGNYGCRLWNITTPIAATATKSQQRSNSSATTTTKSDSNPTTLSSSSTSASVSSSVLSNVTTRNFLSKNAVSISAAAMIAAVLVLGLAYFGRTPTAQGASSSSSTTTSTTAHGNDNNNNNNSSSSSNSHYQQQPKNDMNTTSHLNTETSVPSSDITVASDSASTLRSTQDDPILLSLLQTTDFWNNRVLQQKQKDAADQEERLSHGTSRSIWKDGLVYDSPSDDEPTSCSMCKLFRHGPCRPYQRAVEYCLNHHDQVDNNNNNNKSSSVSLEQQDQPTTAPTPTVKGTDSDCQQQLERLFQECLLFHTGLYRLIDNFLFQQQIDDLEWEERIKPSPEPLPEATTTTWPAVTKQVQEHYWDRNAWLQQIQFDWSAWQSFVLVDHDYTISQVEDMIQQQVQIIATTATSTSLDIAFGPLWWNQRPMTSVDVLDEILDTSTTGRNADFCNRDKQQQHREGNHFNDTTTPTSNATTLSTSSTTAKPYWYYLQDDPDPTLISLSVTCPVVDPNTRYPLLVAYVRDETTGRVLGHVTAPSPSKEEQQQDEEDKSSPTLDSPVNENSQPAVRQNADDHVGNNHDLQKSSSSSKSNHAVTVPFHIIPGWTESIRLLAVYQSNGSSSNVDDDKDDHVNDSKDNRVIVMRESPRVSLIKDGFLLPNIQQQQQQQGMMRLTTPFQQQFDPQRLANRIQWIQKYLEWQEQKQQFPCCTEVETNVNFKRVH